MKRKYKSDTDDELQAQLKGVVMKMIATQSASWSDTDKYENLIAELTLRKIEPIAMLEPTGASNGK